MFEAEGETQFSNPEGLGCPWQDAAWMEIHQGPRWTEVRRRCTGARVGDLDLHVVSLMECF